MSDYKLRLLLIDIIYNAVKHRSPKVTMQSVSDTFNDWEMIPLYRGPAVVGVALRKQSELHLIIDVSFQNMIVFIKTARKIVDDTIAKYNYAETRVVVDHSPGHRLAKLLGFKTVDGCYYRKEIR
jgi:hypothetical protein